MTAYYLNKTKQNHPIKEPDSDHPQEKCQNLAIRRSQREGEETNQKFVPVNQNQENKPRLRLEEYTDKF